MISFINHTRSRSHRDFKRFSLLWQIIILTINRMKCQLLILVLHTSSQALPNNEEGISGWRLKSGQTAAEFAKEFIEASLSHPHDRQEGSDLEILVQINAYRTNRALISLRNRYQSREWYVECSLPTENFKPLGNQISLLSGQTMWEDAECVGHRNIKINVRANKEECQDFSFNELQPLRAFSSRSLLAEVVVRRASQSTIKTEVSRLEDPDVQSVNIRRQLKGGKGGKNIWKWFKGLFHHKKHHHSQPKPVPKPDDEDDPAVVGTVIVVEDGQIRLDPSMGLTAFTVFSLCAIAGLFDLVVAIFVL